MAITLTVEDGSVVENANSYNNLTDLRAYALDRGLTLSVDDDIVGSFAIQAMDYLESFGKYYKGVKVSSEQELSFPRKSVYVDGYLLDYQSIPKYVKNAQSQLVLEQSEGIDISGNVIDGNVEFEKIGPLAVKYFGGSSVTYLSRVMDILSHVLTYGYGSLMVIRV